MFLLGIYDGTVLMSTLRRLHPQLNKYTNLDCLVPFLNKYEILTDDDRWFLNSDSISPKQKIKNLLNSLNSKADESVHKFVLALKEEPEHSGHKELCNLIAQNLINYVLQ